MGSIDAPLVLVVDDNESARRLVRMGLELEGCAVIDAESLTRARNVIHRGVNGVVLDRQLPDGDGLELLSVIDTVCPDARVVVHSTLVDGREPASVQKVDKGDLPAIIDALALTALPATPEGAPLAVVDLVRAEADQVAEEWAELCRWDPLLPPDATPPVARLVVDAVADALQRPQPIGWGADPALTSVAELFALSAGAIDVAIGQLICLREAFRRHLAGTVPAGEREESTARVDMIIDRAIWTASRVAAARLQRQLQFDPLTGLGNRHAFDRDFERELERSSRYQRPLSLVLATVGVLADQHLDELPEPAEAQVRRVAGSLATNVRRQDLVYRIGTATFAVLVPETTGDGVHAMLTRLQRMTMPGLVVGAATYPTDGDDVVSLLHEAEQRRVSASV